MQFGGTDVEKMGFDVICGFAHVYTLRSLAFI